MNGRGLNGSRPFLWIRGMTMQEQTSKLPGFDGMEISYTLLTQERH